jgi:hypothetical protein
MSIIQSSRPAMRLPGYCNYEGCKEPASRDIADPCLACWSYMCPKHLWSYRDGHTCPSYVSLLTTRTPVHSLLTSGHEQLGQ